MAHTETDKPINPSQLSYDMGGAALRVVGPHDDGTTVIDAEEVDQVALDAAVESHVADAGWKSPEQAAAELTAATVAANRATLVERAAAALEANTAYLAKVTPTNSDVAVQVKTLTKECSALIRLALDLLDTTDGT